ncbi:hypothetical protein ACIP66_03110 [Pseudomonas sp. NPDC088429]|uniref:hypothetical protein n=1 Tax=Pseudomonas sp. NPDC088429 TaxID=3364455 RepID=UPI003813B1C8
MTNNAMDFSIQDLIVALLREQNINTGYWGLTMHFNASGTSITKADEPETKLPGLAVCVTGITLVPASAAEDGSIDASLVNPVKKARPKRTTGVKAEHRGGPPK